MLTEPHHIHLFRSPAENNVVKLLKEKMPKDEKEESEAAKFIYCRQCLNIITSPEEKIFINGSHVHTFANPHGIVFEIGCFRNAEGCGYSGQPKIEFTWFKGYSWKIAVCRKCLSHLGWFFMSHSEDSFAGLIINRLVYYS